jgi:hypothetical protein
MRPGFVAFSITCFAFLFNAGVLHACAIGPKPPVLDAYEDSDVVIIARLVSIQKEPGQFDPRYFGDVRSATMIVEKVYKGGVKPREEMVFVQGNGIRCTWTYDDSMIGEKYLLYLQRPERGSSLWQVSGVSDSGVTDRSTSLDDAREDLLYLDNMDKVRGKTRVSGTYGLDGEAAGRNIQIVGPNRTYHIKTGEDGVFEIYGLPPGRYRMEPEVPTGWMIERRRFDDVQNAMESVEGSPKNQVTFIIKPHRHTTIDLEFVEDEGISGRVFGPSGKPMLDVTVHLLKAEDDGKRSRFDTTDWKGRFLLEAREPGDYVLVLNLDGKKSSDQPFPTMYYPNVSEREKATVFKLGPGIPRKELTIVLPKLEDRITVKGIVRYSSNWPLCRAHVKFKTIDKTDFYGDVSVETDTDGSFSLTLLKGVSGGLYGEFDVWAGEHPFCPNAEEILRRSGKNYAAVQTRLIKLSANRNIKGLVLEFPFRTSQRRVNSRSKVLRTTG